MSAGESIEWTDPPCPSKQISMDVFVGSLLLNPHRWAIFPNHLAFRTFPAWMQADISRDWVLLGGVDRVAYTPKEQA
jgi:hypothetical protein